MTDGLSKILTHMLDCQCSFNLFVLLNLHVDGDNIKTHLNEIWREGVDGIQMTEDAILVFGFWEIWQ